MRVPPIVTLRRCRVSRAGYSTLHADDSKYLQAKLSFLFARPRAVGPGADVVANSPGLG